MKRLLGYILLNKDNLHRVQKGILSGVSIFKKEEFLTNSIKVCNKKDKYYVCRVYDSETQELPSDNLLMLPDNEVAKVLICPSCIIGKPRYIGNLNVWKDMYYHGVDIPPNDMELRKWLLINIQNKLSVEPRFKYNPILEMLSKLDKTDSSSIDEKSVEDIFNEGVHINDFSLKYPLVKSK